MEEEMVGVVAGCASDGNDVAEPPRRKQRRPRALPLDEGVRHQGRRVHEAADARGLDSGRRQERGDALHDRSGGVVRGRQEFVGPDEAGADEQNPPLEIITCKGERTSRSANWVSMRVRYRSAIGPT